jgi:hypothetical protein
MSEMKYLRCLFALMLVCALSGMAKADPVDFHMVVVDPPGFDVTDLTTTSATVGFSACDPGQLPTGITGTYVGCDTFENLTGATITSLQLVFPDVGALVGQAANCTPDGTSTLNFFANASCSLVNGEFILNYYGGSGIPVGFPNGVFTIAESGVDPSDFPDGTLTVTPEPSSIWLLSTGALLLGAFFYSRRRNGLGSMGL